MENLKKDYLKNELRSYNYMIQLFYEKMDYYIKKAESLNRRLGELENQLNEFGYSSPLSKMSVIKSSSNVNRTRILEVMSDIDHIKNRIKELDELRIKEVLPLCDRIEYVDNCLNRLEINERNFIIDMHIKKKSINQLKKEYNIDYNQDIYRRSSRYLGYIIYGRKKKIKVKK